MNHRGTKAMSKFHKQAATHRVGVRLHKRKESKANKANAELLSALEARAFQWIVRGHAANLELGRILLQIKAIVGHGQWQHYYQERFASRGVALRTAEEYMRAARKADADQKNADSASFRTARDPQAQRIREATEKAEAEVAHGLKEKVQHDGIFKLPLSLTVDEQHAVRDLLNSPDWPSAQREIVTFLKRLCVRFCIGDRGRDENSAA